MTKKTNKLSKFSDEELYAELNRRHANKEELQYKILDVDGFTSKDVVWGEENVHSIEEVLCN
jgi:hypothetical protein